MSTPPRPPAIPPIPTTEPMADFGNRSDTVVNLSKSYAKRVTLHGTDSFPEIEGMRDFQQLSESISFLYSGDIQLLMQELAKHKINDLTIAEPDLEEIFMHFYTEKGE